MHKMPVLEGIMKYVNEGVTPFHMPGHKNNKAQFEELEIIRENLYKIDNTEVPGLDNLHMPEEIILEGQRLASQAFSSNESFFLINGSTGGIYSMILGVTKPGDKIIMQRNCHRSVFMACLLGDLNAVYIEPTILEEFNIAASLNMEAVINTMDKHSDARAIIVTYPTYYGTCCDLERIVLEAHKRNMLVLVDGAHGAHFSFNSRLPKGAMECGADASVVSLHKSTPALTQTSLLNTGSGIDLQGIRFMLRLFQSTSPSYVLMASIDASRHILETRGKELLDGIIDNIEEFRKNLLLTGAYRILGREHINSSSIKDVDLTKIVIKGPIGGGELDSMLRSDYRIQVEMSDIFNITLISSIGDTPEAFKKLYDALYDISIRYNNKKKNTIGLGIIKHEAVMNMRDAYYKPKKRVKLREAEGLVSAEMISPYPPGIPVILPGEVITRHIIDYIGLVKDKGIAINGISDSTAEYIETVMI